MPKVSVIIPTHNRALYLKRAIRSVLDQTFQDFEIIVVDDTSTDETPSIVEAFSDPRIRYFRHDTNRGEGGSRNTGVQNAVGDYIAFLDDDDTWLPRKLEMQVNLLEASPVKVGAVYTSFHKVDAETGKVLRPWIAEKRGNVLQDLGDRNWIGTPSTILLRRRCFDTVGFFDEQVEFGLDHDMWIRVARFYDFEYIKEPLVLRSINNHDRLTNNYALVLKGAESKLRKHADFFSLNRKAYGRRLFHLGVLYCYNGHLQKGRSVFFEAIRLNPLEMRSYYNFALSLLGAEGFKKLKRFRDKLASW